MAATQTLTPDAAGKDRYAICKKAEAIHGWLEPAAARRTVDILRWQETQAAPGNLMEIGVMCGKYFALLLDSALRRDDTVLGVDTFQYSRTARVDREMKGVFGKRAAGRYRLWERMSSTLTPDEVLAAIGQPRFISIDGAHDMENVFGDLELADAILPPHGIVSADDFLNPLTLGVNEAVNAFLSRPRRMVPVAFIANKLFLAHRAGADDARHAIEDMFRQGGDASADAFTARAGHGRHHVEQPLHGHPVLIG